MGGGGTALGGGDAGDGVGGPDGAGQRGGVAGRPVLLQLVQLQVGMRVPSGVHL